MKFQIRYINYIKNSLNEWNKMRLKRKRREISYENYIEWKLNYEIVGGIYHE